MKSRIHNNTEGAKDMGTYLELPLRQFLRQMPQYADMIMQRFGRDHIKNVYYIEDFFPNYDVRFIDINGNLDSKISDNEFAQFRNTFNS